LTGGLKWNQTGALESNGTGNSVRNGLDAHLVLLVDREDEGPTDLKSYARSIQTNIIFNMRSRRRGDDTTTTGVPSRFAVTFVEEPGDQL